MRINLAHNDIIKTFDDVPRHVELEKDRLLIDKLYGEAYMTKFKKLEPLTWDERNARVR